MRRYRSREIKCKKCRKTTTIIISKRALPLCPECNFEIKLEMNRTNARLAYKPIGRKKPSEKELKHRNCTKCNKEFLTSVHNSNKIAYCSDCRIIAQNEALQRHKNKEPLDLSLPKKKIITAPCGGTVYPSEIGRCGPKYNCPHYDKHCLNILGNIPSLKGWKLENMENQVLEDHETYILTT
jgi:hypothetical protein